jgi:hypothetical protein
MDHKMYTLHHDKTYEHYTSIYNVYILLIDFICEGWEA